MREVRLSKAAEADISAILRRSLRQFGPQARLRYEALILAALRDLAEEPERLGSTDCDDLSPGARIWHLRGSRKRVDSAMRVHEPRHLIFYRLEGPDRVAVGRVLYDAMDLARHVANDDIWT